MTEQMVDGERFWNEEQALELDFTYSAIRPVSGSDEGCEKPLDAGSTRPVGVKSLDGVLFPALEASFGWYDDEYS